MYWKNSIAVLACLYGFDAYRLLFDMVFTKWCCEECEFMGREKFQNLKCSKINCALCRTSDMLEWKNVMVLQSQIVGICVSCIEACIEGYYGNCTVCLYLVWWMWKFRINWAVKACVGLAQYDESEGKHSYHVKEMRAKVHYFFFENDAWSTFFYP